MAVIYLRHPKHGCKVASSDGEAEYDKKLGWKEFIPEPPKKGKKNDKKGKDEDTSDATSKTQEGDQRVLDANEFLK